MIGFTIASLNMSLELGYNKKLLKITKLLILQYTSRIKIFYKPATLSIPYLRILT